GRGRALDLQPHRDLPLWRRSRPRACAAGGALRAGARGRARPLGRQRGGLALLRRRGRLRLAVAGGSQILGQVRDAYESARTRGATGALLNRLFEDALHAGKRVRTEAKLHELPESVAASAVELGVRELGGTEGRRALLFGAGKMSELAARDLRERGAEVVISSRTLESAQDLAGRVGGSAAVFDAVAVE